MEQTSYSRLQMEQLKMSGEDHGVQKSTSMGDQTVRGEELSGDLLGESDKSQPVNTKTDDRESRNDFGSTEGNYICRHHVEPRVKIHNMPNSTENTFDVDQSYTYNKPGCVARKPY